MRAVRDEDVPVRARTATLEETFAVDESASVQVRLSLSRWLIIGG